VVSSFKKPRVEKLNVLGLKRDDDESSVTPKTGGSECAYYYSSFWFGIQDPIFVTQPRSDLQVTNAITQTHKHTHNHTNTQTHTQSHKHQFNDCSRTFSLVRFLF
jgi:hypothetical protein